MRDQALVKATLRVLGGDAYITWGMKNIPEAPITGGATNIGKVAGKIGSQGVSILFSWMDTQAYLERDVSTENPYEWAMRQQEVGIRGINRRIAMQKNALADLVSLRSQWIRSLLKAYCTPTAGYYDQERYKWIPPPICSGK